ncbi:xyloglucan endotransglucosylase/hydrolase protein 2-like [Raphanus sativus]|uniref:Xyloglucan endotransglucosylase/hydrolase n=1 Tax=Raphanus sativus TaxID=3726 RepID=A0A6J0P1E9_RAPSA|nr:xyloglucan endotransglucosylase/hydrolase protein 2-like [Raphanus sativus]
MNKREYMFSILDFVLVLFLIATVDAMVPGGGGFDENYNVTWGNVLKLNQGKEVQLFMDKTEGSAFESKHKFGSGFFQMRIKLPLKDSAGVVTAFYLTSKGDTHDELDFEFLGNREGKQILIQTNVFTNGQGNREQKFVLWFDPSTDFHTYGILWNPYQIVFYVDKTPIRIFKNNRRYGVGYPSKPMTLVCSLWNGEGWATDGGKAKINWSYAPFKANFQTFSDSGCHADGQKINAKVCGSTTYWWNTVQYSRLSANETTAFKNVRAKYVTYDYCSDRPRYPVPPTECRLNQ